MPFKGYKQTKEHVEKVRKNLIGIKRSEKTKKKIKTARVNQIMPYGEKHPMWKGGKPNCRDCGKKISHERIRCRACYLKFSIGKNHPTWLGGKSFEPYTIDWTKTLRQSIRERDQFTCQLCKENQQDRALSIHHIDYNKTNCNPDNLISLCVPCHAKTNFNRNKWKKMFTK